MGKRVLLCSVPAAVSEVQSCSGALSFLEIKFKKKTSQYGQKKLRTHTLTNCQNASMFISIQHET